MEKILLGNEAIVQGALDSGMSFASGYPGCPAAEIGEILGKIGKKYGVYYEWASNEKVALEASIGASFSGLKSLVDMKSFGINVCSDSLFPLAYTGTKAPMVIVVADDPSCWSSAQTEQNSLGYAYLSHIPMLEPADPQECYEFTKLAYKISEKFNTPVILRTTTRVNHQKMPVKFSGIRPSIEKALFVKNPRQFCTMPPRVLEMKKELLQKIEKIKTFVQESEAVKFEGKKNKLGIITSGISYLHTKESQEMLGLDLPLLKLGVFYPVASKNIASFMKGLSKVLVIEELDGYLEKEVRAIAKDANPKLQIHGKDLISETGELDSEKIAIALAKLTKKKFIPSKPRRIDVPRRYPKLCQGCPHLYTFAAVKKAAPDAIIGGDIGCYMIAGYPPHDIQDYLFSMGAGLGISHGVKKSTGQKLITLMGDGTFFHAGIPALINTVYNNSNPLILILDNRITAMTGHQTNPGMGKNAMGEDAKELKIEDIVRACGVENVKVIDPINTTELEGAIKDFLIKDKVSVIVCKRICALLARRQKKAEEV